MSSLRELQSETFLNSPLDQFETFNYTFISKTWASYYNDFLTSNVLIRDFWTFFEGPLYSNSFFLNVIIIISVIIGLQTLSKDKSLLVIGIIVSFCLVNLMPFSFRDGVSILYTDIANYSSFMSKAIFSEIYLDIFVHGTVLSFFAFLFLIESDEEDETLIPRASQMFYNPVTKVLQSLVVSTLGKNLKDEDDLIVLLGGILAGIAVMNVQGMVPYTHTITSSLTNTLFVSLSLFLFILFNMFHQKGITHFLGLFLPDGCPVALVPLLVPIEVISYVFRVVSLSVRLFANMMAGHTLLKVIVGFSWAMIQSGTLIILITNLVTTLALFMLVVLEFAVAFIQTYIYTVLACIYMKDIFYGH